jgi:hypothetical protein
VSFVLSAWLTWALIALIPVAPVALVLFAGDEPRNDEPPDHASQNQTEMLRLAA